MKWCQEPRCSPLVRPVCRGTFGVALRVPNIISHLKTERGTTLETLEGNLAFWYCTSLTSATIGNGVTSIGSQAFYNCSSLKSVTIPNKVTSIGSEAFSLCSSLTSATIGKRVTSIGNLAFYNCTGLTNVTIPDSVTSIGWYAFYGCTSLASVTIPDSVTSIGNYAFANCTSLKTVYCKPTTPPIGGNSMFSYYVPYYYVPIGCKIYVPASDDDSIINAYKAKYYWNHYTSSIFEYDFSAEQ